MIFSRFRHAFWLAGGVAVCSGLGVGLFSFDVVGQERLRERAGGLVRSGLPVKNKVAVFAALNKVTARISTLEVPIDQEQKFGALTIIPKVCTTQPPTEPPATKSFIVVKERKLSGKKHQLFSGWIFAENPGLHAVEHPVYDVWLTSCKMPVGGVASSKSPKLRHRRTRVRSRRR